MAAYYNEIDPFAAAWLRELVARGRVAEGDVDERSIVDVDPADLDGYCQCHFFAGIGVWSHALRLAGWPDDRPVWTGSCPCQPLSGAGQRRGHADERHLWPAFQSLIAECGPPVVFGEQVAGKDGREWLAAVRTDLEACGYAVGAADLCAAGVGAPHIRQRLWWVAKRLGQPDRAGPQPGRAGPEAVGHGSAAVAASGAGGLADAGGGSLGTGTVEGRGGVVASEPGGAAGGGSAAGDRPGPDHGFWAACDWLWCRDGKWRPVGPGALPLAHGSAARVGRLRGYGNAIVAPVAQKFVEAVMEA